MKGDKAVADIRLYRPSDRDDIAEICVRTGRSGTDATGWLDRDDLLPDIYALPYVDFAPDTAFVADVDGRPHGYILGVADTRAFVERLRADWLPEFEAKHPLTGDDTPTQRFVRIARKPERMLIPELAQYPAHLHIDLLPDLQGQGLGRMLVRTLVAELASRGVPGVWLEYGPDNVNAGAFYRRLGFEPLPSSTAGNLVGLRTDAVV
jgi:ribosomal protein S18 acetylase RimI-like enzyme